jgi:hypothetical protein
MPAKFRLPPDLKHVADKTGVKVPTLPWCGKKEWMLHSTLEMSLQGKETENTLDWDLSLAVLQDVDGKDLQSAARKAPPDESTQAGFSTTDARKKGSA